MYLYRYKWPCSTLYEKDLRYLHDFTSSVILIFMHVFPVQSPVSSSWSWKPWSWILFTTSVWWSNLTRQELPALMPGPGRSSFASTWEQTNAASYIWWTHNSAIHTNTRCVSMYYAYKVDTLLLSNCVNEHRLMYLCCSSLLFEVFKYL